MLIIRGHATAKTQIGFFGSPQEVLLQRREAEEGRPLFLRWSEPLRTRKSLDQLPRNYELKKRSRLCLSSLQSSTATPNVAQHSLGSKEQCVIDRGSYVGPNAQVKRRAEPVRLNTLLG